MKKIISCIALMALLMACSKTETTPVTEDTGTGLIEKAKGGNGGGGNGGNGLNIITISVLANSAISAFIQGNINGGGNNIQRGFCCSTETGPTIADDTVMAGTGTGDFSRRMHGLTPGTDYYVRAFAIKQNNQVSYGNELAFTTLTIGMPGEGVGLVYDYDGNEYHTITLGTQVWMVENLKTTHYRDGTPIPNITDNATWGAATTDAYCDYNNDPANSVDYGRMYNWYAVTSDHNLAPEGWHVPTYAELDQLIMYIGGTGLIGRLKETGTDHWLSPNTANNESGFTMVGGGIRTVPGGGFFNLKAKSHIWASTTSNFIAFHFSYDSDTYTYSWGSCDYCLSYGYSVRCVMD